MLVVAQRFNRETEFSYVEVISGFLHGTGCAIDRDILVIVEQDLRRESILWFTTAVEHRPDDEYC